MNLDERIAHHCGPDRIDIAYEEFGHADGPVVLMIQGLAAQLVAWPDGFCAALAAHGFRLIRFDNRDSGRSTHMAHMPEPDLPAVLAGDLSSAGYTLSDMAADVVGLLDALGIASAHVLGASMGGAIAQTMAIEHPARVRSLTSMMSTTGDMKVGQACPATLQALFSQPAPKTRQEVIDRQVQAVKVVGSPGFPVEESEVAARAARAYDRGYDQTAIARQAVASVASGDRTQRLHAIDVPTLVIHGADDAMCDVSGGRATANAIRGAELCVIDGLGHNLPPGVWTMIVERVARIVHAGETRANAIEKNRSP